jgi:hypothetical protein
VVCSGYETGTGMVRALRESAGLIIEASALGEREKNKLLAKKKKKIR